VFGNAPPPSYEAYTNHNLVQQRHSIQLPVPPGVNPYAQQHQQQQQHQHAYHNTMMYNQQSHYAGTTLVRIVILYTFIIIMQAATPPYSATAESQSAPTSPSSINGHPVNVSPTMDVSNLSSHFGKIAVVCVHL
jgi:hypothetical protein